MGSRATSTRFSFHMHCRPVLGDVFATIMTNLSQHSPPGFLVVQIKKSEATSLVEAMRSGLTKEVGRTLFMKVIPKSVDAIHSSARLASEFGSIIL